MATVNPQLNQPNPMVMQPQTIAVPAQPVQGQVYPPPSSPVAQPGIASAQAERQLAPRPELTVIGHSQLFYWWPVWAVGFLMALLTYFQGQKYQIGADLEYYHPSSNLGVMYFLTIFLVILITNVTVRGLASGMVLLALMLVAVVFAYFGWWDAILSWLGDLHVHLNLGAYLWFSALLFVVWALSVFVFDRMTYWRVKPGQVTQDFAIGAASQSFGTENMVLEKYRSDVFRHWLLGFGSGDLHIQPFNHPPIIIPNVLFVGRKVQIIQRLIATQPD